MRFSKEQKFLNQVESHDDKTNEREILDEAALIKLQSDYPNIPDDYLDYLAEIGGGNFRECQFNVQPYLFDFEDIGLENAYKIPNNIMFFGDNFCGDLSGFDFNKNDGKVVEFWHASAELYYTNKSFHEYIREQMLMDDNENDLRQK
ncbi:SMI1/KNR4 family protein [Acetobacteroides hydrogenigenes]|uniref:SUKH superfamily protein n=1 Tax=Acetobacteroides hydrogenigenes TaxID=979970 RepID=A0A4R2EVV1_9BACT|nr:SMI1/KNR4 family protein [Acetobacteroides hydrogenigenes]TCN72816.1 SUKH superfamily protein [Acetobacteroides hydrogenigenes]